MFDIDLLESYAALLIAIRFGIDNSETAFKFMDKALDDPFCKRKPERIFQGKVNVIRKDITDEDIENMMKLRKQRVTYKDIGAIYGLSDNAIYGRIKNYKLKMKEAT